MQRRVFIVTAVGFASFPALATSRFVGLPKECEWMLGSWRSDAERSMANFTFQGHKPPAGLRPKIAEVFGKVTHTFSSDSLVVAYKSAAHSYQKEFSYRVEGFTDTTATIAFPKSESPFGFTLYREEDSYFVRSGDNFEYFRKVAT